MKTLVPAPCPLPPPPLGSPLSTACLLAPPQTSSGQGHTRTGQSHGHSLRPGLCQRWTLSRPAPAALSPALPPSLPPLLSPHALTVAGPRPRPQTSVLRLPAHPGPSHPRWWFEFHGADAPAAYTPRQTIRPPDASWTHGPWTSKEHPRWADRQWTPRPLTQLLLLQLPPPRGPQRPTSTEPTDAGKGEPRGPERGWGCSSGPSTRRGEP